MKKIFFVFLFLSFGPARLFCQSCNLIQNGDFELYTACPAFSGEMDKATNWHQGTTSGGSSDFFHQICGFMNVGGGITPPLPFPSGVGCAGVYINYAAPAPYYKEEAAQFMNFCAGQKYKLEIYLAKPVTGYVNMQNNFSLQIGNAAVLPTAFTPTTLCAVGFNEQTNVTGTLITSSWQKFTRTFTATQNANAFLFAGSCLGPFSATGYVFFDNIKLTTVDTLTTAPTSITTCDSSSFTITIPGGCYGPYDVVINGGSAPDTIFNISSGYIYTVHPVQTTTYTITSIINSLGCSTALNIPVTVNFGSIYSSVNANICNGATYTLPGGNIVSASGIYSDTLASAGGCDSIITTHLVVGSSVSVTTNISTCNTAYTLPGGVIVNVAGTYVDTIASVSGCDSIITTNLTFNGPSSSVQNPVVCAGTSFILPGGNSVNVSGTYSDTLTAANGCDSIITTNLSVNAAPAVSVSADVTITIGSSTTLSATGGGTYSWSPATGLSSTTDSFVVCTPVQNAVYCVTVTNAAGCTDSACVNVTVDMKCGTFYLPNAFSPNGDNENDVFMAYIPAPCVQEYKLIIYNRFGEKIFQTADVNQSWNGEVRGVMSNSGVYAYYCNAVLIDGKEIHMEGNVSLVR